MAIGGVFDEQNSTRCGVVIDGGTIGERAKALARHESSCSDPRCANDSPADVAQTEAFKRDQRNRRSR